MKLTLAIVLAAAVAGGIVGAAVGLAIDDDSAASTATTVETASPISTSLTGLTPEQIYRSDAQGVVVITDTQTDQVPATAFSPPRTHQVEALGSGFVIDKQGDIVTNDHVVQGATGIRVGFSSGATYPATIAGTDPSTDVAVVRVKAPASALHPLAFENSSTAEVGDPVYAIGNPFGLDRTMTAGIVSATDRDIQAPNGFTIPNAIQTDAAINHGNSGGPLLDRFGRVVGINSQIQGGTVDANVGMGFAISSNAARAIADELIATGHAVHAWLGVQVETIDPSVAKIVGGLPAQGVIVVRVVKGSPAAKAGLKGATRQKTVNGVTALLGGDAIVRVDGNAISTAQQLSSAAALRKPGDQVKLNVVRAGKSLTVTVTLGNVPAQP
ncbi:MAG: S1C family serine protease [Gaiellaceae bacterium]